MLLLINYISGRFSKSIQHVQNLMNSPSDSLKESHFPKDEFGEIAEKILASYRQLNDSRRALTFEREKLLQHVHSSEEGICFFTTEGVVEFYNGLFIQYINTIADEANSNASIVLSDPAFEKVSIFLLTKNKTEHYFETHITRHGKIFIARVNVFDDGSFELIINDITNQEKNRMLKQEMTGNITHELRTPVTGIRGYLETVLNNTLDREKERYFIERAYRQTLLLSELISDMGLLAKIDASPHSFSVEPLNIRQLLEELRADLEIPLNEKNITMHWNVDETVTVRGNRNLLYAIFRNLTDNSIRYAGNNVTVFINKYSEDSNFYYFSFADNGPGIAEEHHLNRLFERFYRVSEGRTRETGGSGLGLSIVKNAVTFHKGTIVAKNRTDGGLKFLFHLEKSV
jgi:signal transduction histidine kinase